MSQNRQRGGTNLRDSTDGAVSNFSEEKGPMKILYRRISLNDASEQGWVLFEIRKSSFGNV